MFFGLDPITAPWEDPSQDFPRLLSPLCRRAFFAKIPPWTCLKMALENMPGLVAEQPSQPASCLKKVGGRGVLRYFCISKNHTFSSRWQKFSQLVQFFIPANPRISGLCSLSSVCMQPSRVFPWAISYSSYSGQSAGKRSAFRHLLIIPALSGPFSVFWFAASNSYNKCFTTV